MTIARLIREYQPLKITLTRINGMWSITAKTHYITKSYISDTVPSEKEMLLVLEGIEKSI